MTHWPSVLAAVLALIGSAGIGGLLKTWLDHKRAARGQTDEVALALVAKLEARVDALEAALADERARCDAELRLLRHRAGNLAQMIDALLLIFEMPAAKAKEQVAQIRAQRAAMVNAEAIEAAAVLAAPLPSPKSEDL